MADFYLFALCFSFLKHNTRLQPRKQSKHISTVWKCNGSMIVDTTEVLLRSIVWVYADSLLTKRGNPHWCDDYSHSNLPQLYSNEIFSILKESCPPTIMSAAVLYYWNETSVYPFSIVIQKKRKKKGCSQCFCTRPLSPHWNPHFLLAKHSSTCEQLLHTECHCWGGQVKPHLCWFSDASGVGISSLWVQGTCCLTFCCSVAIQISFWFNRYAACF